MSDIKVPVWFRYYGPRGIMGMTVKHITTDTANKLIDVIDNAGKCEHPCMELVSVQLRRTKMLDADQDVPATYSLVLNRPRYPFNLTNDGRVLPRGICMKRARSDWGAAIRQCIKNIETGKCTDEYVRNTIGAVLWPQVYRDLKQKTK